MGEDGLHWTLALVLLFEKSGQRVKVDAVSYSAALHVCEKNLRWAQSLLLLRAMVEEGQELRIELHSAVCITNLLHQVDAWDDPVDRNAHHRAYAPVLCALSLVSFRRGVSLSITSFARGHSWEKALGLWGEMLEKQLEPTLVGVTASVCAAASGRQLVTKEAFRRTCTGRGRELDCSLILELAPLSFPKWQ